MGCMVLRNENVRGPASYPVLVRGFQSPPHAQPIPATQHDAPPTPATKRKQGSRLRAVYCILCAFRGHGVPVLVIGRTPADCPTYERAPGRQLLRMPTSKPFAPCARRQGPGGADRCGWWQIALLWGSINKLGCEIDSVPAPDDWKHSPIRDYNSNTLLSVAVRDGFAKFYVISVAGPDPHLA